jgi:hypothetical protein
MKTLSIGDIITYNKCTHRVIRIFEYKGEQKIELRNLHNNQQFIVPYINFSLFILEVPFEKK